jgi:hypothetical protein
MGRQDNEASEQPAAAETGAEVIHGEVVQGMGLSSEHDEGEVQEVDSREEE